ncbi:MAG TPA: endonuclease domain-containing protein [Caulobacteraceae bacterium]|jgi:very-short-patch-repair endonuclease|nr:endonuclease domain-containing protein [Caulobacteraceae bacterium]
MRGYGAGRARANVVVWSGPTLKPRTQRARELRQASTEAERKLWSLVRNRKIAGCKFRRQVPIDRYFADFACLEARLIVELDGGQHAEQVVYDTSRTQALEAAGWTVLRFWNRRVLENPEGVAMAIRSALESARP